MTTFLRAGVMAGWVVAALAVPAHAFHGRWFGVTHAPAVPAGPVAVQGYYFAVPVRVAQPVVCVPMTAPPQVSLPVQFSTYAQPVAAPPSQLGETAEPPTAKDAAKPPKVTESRSTPVPGQDRVRVGFWNVTDRDVVVVVAGDKRVVPRHRAVTVEVGREFTWQVGQGPPQTVRVPAGQAEKEIVIR